MELLLASVLHDVFGSRCRLLSHYKISDGYRNSTFKINCSEYYKPLFIKIEKPFSIPRTQVYQIKKEVAGIRLCENVGISVPTIIKSDEDGQAFGYPWILEDFIDHQLISDYKISEENRMILGREFEQLYSRISSIKNEYYGDTFSNGYIGQHPSWKDAVSRITNLIFEDCMEIGVFHGEVHIIDLAMEKALSQIKSKIQSVFFHCDLFSQNIMGVEKHGDVHISHVIDFGMSLFTPHSYSQYLTWKYTDFLVTPIDICRKFGIGGDELMAYDILRIEPILLANIFKHDNFPALSSAYIQRCRNYLNDYHM